MNKILRAGSALLLASVSLSAVAADETRSYFSGGYEYVFDDKDRNSEPGHGGYLGFGGAVTKLVGYEFDAFYHGFDSSGSNPNQWKDYGLKLDGMFFYSRNSAFSPYLGMSIGVIRSKFENLNVGSTDPFVDFGLGFFSYFAKNLGVRGDLRYRWLNPDVAAGAGYFGEPVARIGLVVPFGNQRFAETAMADTVASDGKVTQEDSDGDGVPNTSDKCPGTPKGWLVDASGCPIDSDHDGVPDNLDKCPGTPVGIAVDAKGCPVNNASAGPARSFENVNFAYDKSDLTDYAKALLDNSATVIGGLAEKYPSLKVDVSGHTDWVGTDAYNQALSERRANAVKAYLTKKGVPASRIRSFAYGETKPIAPNETEEGRALNRRAEVRTHE